MTNLKIVSQIINGLATIINMIGINTPNKRKTLLYFIFGNTCVAISLALLNATSGMLIEFIFVIQTIINYFWERKNTKYPIWIILIYIIIPCIIIIITFQSTWDILSLIAGILFPLALISKNFTLRILNLFSVAVWIPYNFHFGQYVGTISCIIFTITNLIAIIRFDVSKQYKNKE